MLRPTSPGSTLPALKYRDWSPRCCKRAKPLFSVRGHIRKKALPMIGGRMCWRTPVPADKREAATAVVL